MMDKMGENKTMKFNPASPLALKIDSSFSSICSRGSVFEPSWGRLETCRFSKKALACVSGRSNPFSVKFFFIPFSSRQ